MKRRYNDPNEEVERWKDALYENIKNLSGEQLNGYLEKGADQILKKHGIRCMIKHPASLRVH